MGGFPLGYTKSEFYTITSQGEADFQPIDLTGAREVVFVNGGAVNGFLTDQPQAASARIPINTTFNPLVVHSTDGRLYWVSSFPADAAVLSVWVIRG